MKLTQRQKQRIRRYLHDVNQHFGDLPDAERRDVNARLRGRIDRELRQFGDDAIADRDVDGILRSCGSPASQAASLLGKEKQPVARALFSEDRVWLGICGAIADRLDLEPNAVRLIAVLIGLVFPLLPILLIAYVGTYFAFHYTSDRTDLAPLPPLVLAKRLGAVFAVAFALHFGATLVMEVVRRLLYRFLELTVVAEGGWGWLGVHGGALFFWVVMVAIPLAALSTLPVSEEWSGTLKKVVKAGLAAYALVLCFGVACYLVGVIIHIADNFAGITTLQSIL